MDAPTLVAGSGPIGGASVDAGVEYGRAAAAYVVAHALAGEPLPGFGFDLGIAKVASVAVETDEPVDDLRVRFADGRLAQVQAKLTVARINGKAMAAAAAQWGRAARGGVDPQRERLVLVTASAGRGVQSLAAALERCKTDVPGAPTAAQAKAMAVLDRLLAKLTDAERDLVRRCAVITVLDAAEEHAPAAGHARLLLARALADPDDAVVAWRELIAGCGRVARLRGGYEVEGWVRLLHDRGVAMAAAGSPAAAAARTAAAVDAYRAHVRERGRRVDLRPLGADAAPVAHEDLNADVECVPTGADRRDTETLPWSLLRRRRILLTGLPGAGKSVALASAAATLAEAAGAPLPLLVSLRDVDARDRTVGFVDRARGARAGPRGERDPADACPARDARGRPGRRDAADDARTNPS
jgi:hypothetical protein